MKGTSTVHRLIRRTAWLAGLLPLAGGLYATNAQVRPTLARQWEAALKASRPRPRPGQIIFNDPSPRPSGHDLSRASYVGYQVCAGCHGSLKSTRPDHTLIQEWEAPSNAHAKDGATLLGGRLNVYERNVTDGEAVDGPKKCAVCHTTGAPTFDQPQVAQQGGFDPGQPWNEHLHNVRFLKVQCENCHGPGSLHVLSGGDPRLINRVPDPKQTCWKCHVHAPNEKGNTPRAPATDEQIAKYGSSLVHSHNAGILIAGAGGYEYPGEDYEEGHNFPHTKIRTTCVTCHLPRDRRSPILDHSNLLHKLAACRNCHGDAQKVVNIDDWPFLQDRQNTVRQLLIQLGGAGATGDPDFNAGGGLLGNAADKTSPEYRRARWNYSLVINDASLGVHNFDYAVELLLTSISHAPAQARPGDTRHRRAAPLAEPFNLPFREESR